MCTKINVLKSFKRASRRRSLWCHMVVSEEFPSSLKHQHGESAAFPPSSALNTDIFLVCFLFSSSSDSRWGKPYVGCAVDASSFSAWKTEMSCSHGASHRPVCSPLTPGGLDWARPPPDLKDLLDPHQELQVFSRVQFCSCWFTVSVSAAVRCGRGHAATCEPGWSFPSLSFNHRRFIYMRVLHFCFVYCGNKMVPSDSAPC